jgi:hypothetical protein
MVMNTSSLDHQALRRPATLLLLGQILYVVVTLLHTGGEANHHAAIFAAYAASRTWTAVHVAQFACMATMLAGLLALFPVLEVEDGTAGLAGRLGGAATTATLALYGVILAVDGVALKQAVDAWAHAPEAEKAVRFASAETMRWLEWGSRSYANVSLGLAVFLAGALVRKAGLPRAMTYVMWLTALAYLVQGWLSGIEGFSTAHTWAIIAAELLNAVWMTWLLVGAWRRMPPCPTNPTPNSRIAG